MMNLLADDIENDPLEKNSFEKNFENDSDDAFSDSSSDALRKKNVSKRVFKSVFKSVLKRVSKSVKSVFNRSASSLRFAYLLNVRVLYEKNVIFETSLSHHVNSDLKKRFFLRSYINQMTTKAANHVNDKMLACHLITLKATVV
jgi:hypothetical protein